MCIQIYANIILHDVFALKSFFVLCIHLSDNFFPKIRLGNWDLHLNTVKCVPKHVLMSVSEFMSPLRRKTTH